MERPINGEDAKKETNLSVKSDPEPEHPNVDPQGENVREKEIISSDTNFYNNDIHVDATSTNSKSSEISESASASASDGDRSASPLSLKSKKSVRWSEELVSETPRQRALAQAEERGGSNPYTTLTPADSDNTPSINFKEKVESVKDVLGRWGRSVKEATKKAEELAGNTWQHLKTGPSVTDAALGRLAQGTKVLAEGGYEKIFRQTFETVPEEKLQNSYACYLSTSAGPVMGVLYVSSAKLAFCSDSPLSYKSDDKTEWSYYKVVIPLHQLKGVNPSASRNNPSEKYIQVISVDSHEFWFMGFLTYDGAVQCLQEALVPHQAG